MGNGAGRAIDLEDEPYLSRLLHSRVLAAGGAASLGRAFQVDGRGFSPIEGGLEGGGSVSWKCCDQVVDKGSR
jgi:hypothetical protein